MAHVYPGSPHTGTILASTTNSTAETNTRATQRAPEQLTTYYGGLDLLQVYWAASKSINALHPDSANKLSKVHQVDSQNHANSARVTWRESIIAQTPTPKHQSHSNPFLGHCYLLRSAVAARMTNKAAVLHNEIDGHQF